MGRSRMALAGALLATAALAGCTSERFNSLDTQPAPAPLAPAPVGQVTTAAPLPPPAGTAAAPLDPTQFPAAPTTGTQVAAVTPATPPAGGPALTTGSVAGVWNASVAGQSCRVATPQTKFGQGFRAGPLRCPAPLDGVKSWNVSGNQLSLYDTNGSVLARLYSSGPEKFDGQTESGVAVSLTR